MTVISLLSLYIITMGWMFSINNTLNEIKKTLESLTDLGFDQFKILFKSQESMQNKLDSIKFDNQAIKEILKDNNNDTKWNGSI